MTDLSKSLTFDTTYTFDSASAAKSLLKLTSEEQRYNISDYLNLSVVTLSKCDEICEYIKKNLQSFKASKSESEILSSVSGLQLLSDAFDTYTCRCGKKLHSVELILNDFQKRYKAFETSMISNGYGVSLSQAATNYNISQDYIKKIQRVYVLLF